MYYTINGSQPSVTNPASMIYTAPITVTSSETT
ncbi:FN3 associated domain-containing protein [Clostridium ragsdalei]